MNNTLPPHSIWHCTGCNAWWAAIAGRQRQTWQLYGPLQRRQLATLDLSVRAAWIISGSDPGICPECGSATAEREGQLQDVSNLIAAYSQP